MVQAGESIEPEIVFWARNGPTRETPEFPLRSELEKCVSRPNIRSWLRLLKNSLPGPIEADL